MDFGESWCGLATSEGYLSEPWGAVPTAKVFSEISQLHPELVVIGVSEGAMAQKTREFGRNLVAVLNLPIEFVDETLTSHEAEDLSSDKQKQHAVAAAFILQRYLDNQPKKT